jgi:Shikimate 5-dehydrogenase
MKRYGLIGFPIGHSLSPELFRAAYPQCDGFSYDLIETPSFDEAFNIFLEQYDGVNVTAPFKEAAFARADRSDPVTGILEAANILVKDHGDVKAYNSDFWAVSRLLRFHLPAGEKPPVLVIGCGGAGKAAALAASDLGLEVTIANRDVSRAERFAAKAGEMNVISLDDIPKATFGAVVYAVPAKIPQIEFLSKIPDILIIEANYRTPMLSESRQYVSGKSWLAEQAITGYSRLTGKLPSEDGILSAIH